MYTIRTTTCFHLILLFYNKNIWSKIKTCEGKSLRLKTKTFGGKIWTHLHSVSPYNFLRKKFIEVTLQKFLIAKQFLKSTARKVPSKSAASPRIEKAICTSRNEVLLNSLERTLRWFLYEVMHNFLKTWKKWKDKPQIVFQGDKIKLYSKIDFESEREHRINFPS